MKKFLFSTVFIGLVAASCFHDNSSIAVTATQPLPKTPPVLKLTDPLPSNLFIELAKAINPSVVNISTSVIPKGRRFRDPMLEMLEQFYGLRQPEQSAPGKPQRMGLGTGFIIRDDGLIVTNNHVIEGADIIEVQLTENTDKSYKAEVIGRDARTDIALIKIKPDIKLIPAVLGSSDETQVGEWVAAFGNPYGHGHTMTKGIISSKGREIGEINKFPLLQTDASINPGNSGGPLVNAKGLVIGVNSAIDARAQGIGFAIPIDEVKKILPQLEQRGSIRKGYLNIGLGDLDDRAASALNMDDYRGAVVVWIGADGPGKKAGLKVYDIITEFNGKKIRSSRDLIDLVGDIEPGTKAKAKILRNENTQEITITVAERPDEKTLARQKLDTSDEEEVSATKEEKNSNTPYNLGIKITDLNQNLKSEYNLPADIKNPMITAVDRGSIGSRIGLRVGDIILGVNKIAPQSANDAIKAIKKGTNTIRVGRGRGMTAITFDLK
ncbi:MAG: trypsin-like peptidase domain-containing protein [Pseudobdellovibrio sp.]